MYWSFATINNKPGEIYFHRAKRGGKAKIVFEGHCYVREGEIKNQQEMRALKEETAKYHISYRNGKYRMSY